MRRRSKSLRDIAMTEKDPAAKRAELYEQLERTTSNGCAASRARSRTECMVEEEQYCIDILIQVSAMTKALQSITLGLVDEHMAHCVVDTAPRW